MEIDNEKYKEGKRVWTNYDLRDAINQGYKEALKDVWKEFDSYFKVWVEKWATKKVTARAIVELKGFKQKLKDEE